MLKPQSNYIECKRCLFNSINYPDLKVYSESCSVCSVYDSRKILFLEKFHKNKEKLNEIISDIKKSKSANSKYDCLVGLSGGVDSSYLALKLVDFGLTPLVVHLDNGWNSNEAVTNIHNVVEKLGLDLITIVLDWEEFKEMQKAYFKASVLDIEVLNDQAITASLFKVASEKNIKYILWGVNFVTENILPEGWYYNKQDYVNLVDIVTKNSNVKFRTYPVMTWAKKKYYKKIKKIKTCSLLDYIDYDKGSAIIELQNRLNYVKYAQKHFESVFTRFYQGYILPKKFGVDKRVAHLSSLILAGSMTREEGIYLLNNNEYNEEAQMQDYEYVRKKLGYSIEEFESYFKSPPVSHSLYATEISIRKLINPLKWFTKK